MLEDIQNLIESAINQIDSLNDIWDVRNTCEY